MPGFDNNVVYAGNVDFSGASPVVGQMVADGQLLIGAAAAPNLRVNTLASADGTVTITNGAGTIDLSSLGVNQINTIYVGKHGNDANDGLTIDKAKITIQAGVTAAAAGSTVVVFPGTYAETVTMAANNVIVLAIGNSNDCIIQQADANVVDFGAFTGVEFKGFTIQCTAATTAINTVQGSTGDCLFEDCYLRMISAAAIVAVNQPAVGAVTGTGTISCRLGLVDYFHTGACGGAALKGAFSVANGGLINLSRSYITVTNSGTALASGVGIDLATTGVFTMHSNNITVTDPTATYVVGLAYVGGTGIAHEYYKNQVHIIANANTAYGFYADDTATASRFMFNHLHSTDVAGLSYSFHIGNTSSVISQFNDVIAADNYTLVGGGTFIEVSSQADGQLSVTNLTANNLVLGGGSGPLTPLGALTNGQLAVGSTGAAPVAASLIAPAAGVTITGGAGTITFALADDLAALEGLAATGVASRTAANTWGASTITQNAVIYGGAGETLSNLGPLTNGQLVIGSTGATPAAAVLTAGAGIGVANGAGTITISATGGGLTWTTVGASTPLVVNNGFICTAGAALSFSLPAASAVGDVVAISLDGSVSWTITQGAGQQIRMGNVQTTAGAGGSLASTAQGDTVTLVCSVANSRWNCISSMGNLAIV